MTDSAYDTAAIIAADGCHEEAELSDDFSAAVSEVMRKFPDRFIPMSINEVRTEADLLILLGYSADYAWAVEEERDNLFGIVKNIRAKISANKKR